LNRPLATTFHRRSGSRVTWTAALITAVVLAAPIAGRADNHEAPGLWEREKLLGDPGGIRGGLKDNGITIRLTETSAVWGNVAGGIKRGVVYNGVTELGVEIDTGKLGLWQGGLFVASALQIHGRGPSANLVGNAYHPVATTEALRATRLYDLYYEQSLFDKTVSIRIGQFRADSEFAISQYGPVEDIEEHNDRLSMIGATDLFMNGSFGFPAIAASGLPQGGPAYPLSALGVRVKYQPIEEFALLGAVFNGLTAGRGGANPQYLNRGGTRFPLGDGVTVFGEAQFSMNQGHFTSGLPGMYRVGGWYNSRGVADTRYDTNGLSLANPASNGIPYRHRATYGLYIGGDQMVWRPEAEGKDKGIGLFARIMAAPGDRNQLSFYVNGGMTWKGMLPERDDDVFGIGVAHGRVGGATRGFDADVGFFNPGMFSPVRTHETVIEATYAFQAAPWWTIKPNAQYVIRPGGGVVDPYNATRIIGNAFVLGLVTQVKF
jgi:porin